jgi:broad specificity phosphatase PhoE
VIALVRHGRTEANRAGLLLGRADPPLDDTGRAQASALAASFADAPVAVISSPLRRTVATAEAIAAPWGLAVETDERLIELDYGEWDERPLADVPVEAWVRWRDEPTFAPPGGESLADVQRRVATCVAELLERAGDATIVAVSHVSPIKAAAAWALGAGPELSWRLRLDVASITKIVQGPAAPVLVTWNETAAR